jgi:hypothetical protein
MPFGFEYAVWSYFAGEHIRIQLIVTYSIGGCAPGCARAKVRLKL